MKVNERIYFIRKLKNYMDEENLVSMEVNLQHQSFIDLTIVGRECLCIAGPHSSYGNALSESHLRMRASRL
jgi:hypothetical protein